MCVMNAIFLYVDAFQMLSVHSLVLNHLRKILHVHVNSNDETHLINSQLSTHFSNNLTDGLSEGQSSSGVSIEGISDETVANLRLCKKGMNMGVLNIQGLSSKFSEIQILLSFNIRRKQKLAYFQYV